MCTQTQVYPLQSDPTRDTPAIEFMGLDAQRNAIGEPLQKAINGVLQHGRFIMGPEVELLEDRLGSFCGAASVVSCSSGTDGLLLSLMALGVGRGDAVFVPSFTFASTAEAVAITGATPVFLDVVEEDFNVDPAHLSKAVVALTHEGLKPKCLLAVDLFGQPARYEVLEPLCDELGLTLIADAAQSFGGSLNGRHVGSIGRFAVTSFFPTKPLGCYGDGGAVMTDDLEAAEILRSLRTHGKGRSKYENVRVGLNARLDTLQAAILLEKLNVFERELKLRGEVAMRYMAMLPDEVATPQTRPGARSAWAQYTVLLRAGTRSKVMEHLKSRGVPSAVYYEKPLHEQPAYRDSPRFPDQLSVSEMLSKQVLSLPMHPYLEVGSQERVAEALAEITRSEQT